MSKHPPKYQLLTADFLAIGDRLKLRVLRHLREQEYRIIDFQF